MSIFHKNKTEDNNSQKEKQPIFTKETFGVIIVLFASLCMVCLITRDKVFSLPGKAINSFFLGLFGYFSYLVLALILFGGICLIVGKAPKFSVKSILLSLVIILSASALIHIITMVPYSSLSYEEYLKVSYEKAMEGGISTCSGGGLFAGLYSYVFSLLLGKIGPYIVLGLIIIGAIYSFVKRKVTLSKTADKKKEEKQDEKQQPVNNGTVEPQEERIGAYSMEAQERELAKKQKLFVLNKEEFSLKTKREIKRDENSEGIKLQFSKNGLCVCDTDKAVGGKYSQEMLKKLDYIKRPATPDFVKKDQDSDFGKQGYTVHDSYDAPPSYSEPQISKPISRNDGGITGDIPIFSEDNGDINGKTIGQAENDYGSAEQRAKSFSDKYLFNTDDLDNKEDYDDKDDIFSKSNDKKENNDIFNFNGFDKKDEDQIDPSTLTSDQKINDIFKSINEEKKANEINGFNDFQKEEKPIDNPFERQKDNGLNDVFGFGGFGGQSFNNSEEEVKSQPEQKKEKVVPPINREYNRPPMNLLESYSVVMDEKSENHQERMSIIQNTLAEFKINMEAEGYVQGPAITRYQLVMPAGIPVRSIMGHDKDLQMRLSTKNEVRIEAPIPGENLVGVEVANNNPVTVGLKEVLEGMEGAKLKKDALVFAIGKDLVGNSKYDNLAKGPHYLVAGATGSGKSVCLNVMIVSLIMRYSPEELRLILIDPKRVEFRKYEHIPHLMIDEIINEPKRVLATLSWAYNEMERRYQLFEQHGGMIVDLESYNENVANATTPKLARIVIVVDELADLMETCKKDLESRIRALAQKSRAAGIHLVLATQRPSVDIITGTIKANLPSRIAFKVMNFTDSQTILGEQGAEKLLGNGDMLYKNSVMPSVERYQGAYISSREVNNVVTYIKEHNTAYFDQDLLEYLDNETKVKEEDEEVGTAGDLGGNKENNELFLRALALGINTGTISISAIQRRFQVGYARAGGIFDKMDSMGFISPNEGGGSKARKVLLTKEGFEKRFGPMPE